MIQVTPLPVNADLSSVSLADALDMLGVVEYRLYVAPCDYTYALIFQGKPSPVLVVADPFLERDAWRLVRVENGSETSAVTSPGAV